MTTDPCHHRPAPAEVAIPRRELLSADVARKELPAVFGVSWLFVAHESELAAPGSFVTRRMGTDGVIVTRGADGGVSVVLNSCAHRGSPVCDADLGTARRFTCPYHGWVFEPGGRLVGVPGLRIHYPPEFDRSAYSLPAARVACASGLIFATWQPDGPTLADELGPMAFYLEALLGRTAGGLRVSGPPIRWRVPTDWKLSVENFAFDSLHLEHLHRGPAEVGVFGAGPAPAETVVVDCGHGHGIEATKLPADFPDRFPGFPPALWSEADRMLTPPQLRFAERNLVAKGNVFPNLSVIQLYHDTTGDETLGPVSGTMLRQVHPLGPSRAEVWMWTLVPCDADPVWQAESHRSLLRTLGPGGTFEPDDLVNCIGTTRATKGLLGRDQSFIYAGGLHHPDAGPGPWAELPGRVTVCGTNAETMQRAFYRTWRDRLAAWEPAVAAE